MQQRRKLIAIIFVLLGSILLVGSIYFFIVSNKTVLTTDKTAINEPSTSVTKSARLEERGNPYQINLLVEFEQKKPLSQTNTHVFSYTATISNARGEVLEQKNSNFNFQADADNKFGGKSSVIPLFSLKNLPGDTYAIAITVTPDKMRDQAITLGAFSFTIKSNVRDLPLASPIIGLVLLPVGYILFPKKHKPQEVTDVAKKTEA